jgi:CubicO group peptidase (beta-lactamase class C family)
MSSPVARPAIVARREGMATGASFARAAMSGVVSLALAVACTPGQQDRSARASSPPIRWPTEAWPTAVPEAQGLDSLRLATILEDVRPHVVQIHSVLIVRSGSVVLDAYVYPYDRSIPHDLASVTKSVTSTLIGIAATRGELDLDAPVVSFFSDRDIANRADKERITVRDLLSMSSGLDCRDWPNEQTQVAMRQSADWIQFVLDLPMVEEPGTTFSYCSPGMHLLSAILQRATGTSALAYARANLFRPLGIEDADWPSDAQGVTHGWGDLALKPTDAAKLGFLYLNGGTWNGRRILSTEWIAEATTPHVRTGQAEDYGYGWWVSPPGSDPAFFRADGNGGQRILVVPSLDLVIVTTGGGDSGSIFSSVAEAASAGPRQLPPNPTGLERLRRVIAELARGPAPEPVPPPPPIAERISGQTYEFGPDGPLRSVRVDFGASAEATLRVDVEGEPVVRVDTIGLDGLFRPSREGRPILARGSWLDERTFVVRCDEGPGLRTYDLVLRFQEHEVTVEVLGERLVGRTIRG